jgi:hypothetical protein
MSADPRAEALAVAVAALEKVVALRYGTLFDLGRQAVAAQDALARIAAIEAAAPMSQTPASNDAAIWDEYPRPWRVEEDWTAEVLAANGKLVIKIPYPKELWIARLLVNLVNATAIEAAVPPSGEEAIETLSEFGQHKNWCLNQHLSPDYDCQCGWNKARKQFGIKR